jgi:hypothetical protein
MSKRKFSRIEPLADLFISHDQIKLHKRDDPSALIRLIFYLWAVENAALFPAALQYDQPEYWEHAFNNTIDWFKNASRWLSHFYISIPILQSALSTQDNDSCDAYIKENITPEIDSAIKVALKKYEIQKGALRTEQEFENRICQVILKYLESNPIMYCFMYYDLEGRSGMYYDLNYRSIPLTLNLVRFISITYSTKWEIEFACERVVPGALTRNNAKKMWGIIRSGGIELRNHGGYVGFCDMRWFCNYLLNGIVTPEIKQQCVFPYDKHYQLISSARKTLQIQPDVNSGIKTIKALQRELRLGSLKTQVFEDEKIEPLEMCYLKYAFHYCISEGVRDDDPIGWKRKWYEVQLCVPLTLLLEELIIQRFNDLNHEFKHQRIADVESVVAIPDLADIVLNYLELE